MANDTIEKLKYIGLNLEKIPDFLKITNKINYSSSKTEDSKKYKVYRYIDTDNIEILLTPTNRLNETAVKYNSAIPLYEFLKPGNKELYSVFNSLLKTTSKDDINELEETQEKLNKKMPLDVKFNKDYLWQIYYSDIEDKHFMMVPINETECEALFFLLKQQLSGENRKIYVPICHLGYSDKFLMEQEIKDIENALWLFTGNWAAIYEVYDKSDNMTLVIRGKTKIFENVTSDYKIELKTKEEAREFYNLVQALFLLQTHYPKNYNFKVKVLETGEIQFAQNDISIDAEHMLDFIQEQYSNNILDITKLREEQINLNNKLKNLKKLEVKKQEEFLEKERKIATFLQCKKSFFGKLKYFLVYKKSKPDINLEETKEKIEEPTIKYFEKTKTKKIYSMQELMESTKELEKETTTTNSLKLDIDGIQRKLDMLTNKIKNANLYIEEIDKHTKSIFDFWKFTMQDNREKLNVGKEENNKKIRKSFDIETDLDDLKEELDRDVRKKLNAEEKEKVFLATTTALRDINLLLNGKNIPNGHLEDLKEELEKNRKDLAFSVTQKTKQESSNTNFEHREAERNKFSVLNIDEDTTQEEYENCIKEAIAIINNAKEKITTNIELPLYLIDKGELPNGFAIFSIDPTEEIKRCEEGKVNVYKIVINEETKYIPLTNIIYFTNLNQTLPLGMHNGSRVLIDLLNKSPKLISIDKNNVLTIKENGIKRLNINIMEYEI